MNITTIPLITVTTETLTLEISEGDEGENTIKSYNRSHITDMKLTGYCETAKDEYEYEEDMYCDLIITTAHQKLPDRYLIFYYSKAAADTEEKRKKTLPYLKHKLFGLPLPTPIFDMPVTVEPTQDVHLQMLNTVFGTTVAIPTPLETHGVTVAPTGAVGD